MGLSGACAVLFDENCCKTAGITGGKTFHVVQRGEEGKLCGLVSRLNPLSSCQGPRIKDDIESLVVMPGCTLEFGTSETVSRKHKHKNGKVLTLATTRITSTDTRETNLFSQHSKLSTWLRNSMMTSMT